MIDRLSKGEGFLSVRNPWSPEPCASRTSPRTLKPKTSMMERVILFLLLAVWYLGWDLVWAVEYDSPDKMVAPGTFKQYFSLTTQYCWLLAHTSVLIGKSIIITMAGKVQDRRPQNGARLQWRNIRTGSV